MSFTAHSSPGVVSYSAGNSSFGRAEGFAAEHPIIRALPPEAVNCIELHGIRVTEPARTPLDNATPHARFVVSGAIGVFPAPDSACVAMIGPGGLQGLEHCFLESISERHVVLVDAEWIEVPAAALALAMGKQWAERMFAYQASGRLRLLGAEAACNARHPVSQRLARWLLRLHEAAGSPRRLEITQSLLGEILGVQRTTVNAAVGYLHQVGVVDNTRGRITIPNRDALSLASCGCGDAPRGG
ncbi:MAG TPA: Crp/Fnr family transcriptional regulator [Brevundimonas sp.]|jgi:CRP-like cAMP-binding protein